jgi:hypothetical protein
LDGKPLVCTVKAADGLTVIEFSQPLTLKFGQTLSLK